MKRFEKLLEHWRKREASYRKYMEGSTPLREKVWRAKLEAAALYRSDLELILDQWKRDERDAKIAAFRKRSKAKK